MVIFHSYVNVYQRVVFTGPTLFLDGNDWVRSNPRCSQCSRNNATIAVRRFLDDTPTPNTQEIWQRNASLGEANPKIVVHMASGHTKGLREMYGNVFPNLNLSRNIPKYLKMPGFIFIFHMKNNNCWGEQFCRFEGLSIRVDFSNAALDLHGYLEPATVRPFNVDPC